MKIDKITYQDGVCRMLGKATLSEKLAILLSRRIYAEVKLDSKDAELEVKCEVRGNA